MNLYLLLALTLFCRPAAAAPPSATELAARAPEELESIDAVVGGAQPSPEDPGVPLELRGYLAAPPRRVAARNLSKVDGNVTGNAPAGEPIFVAPLNAAGVGRILANAIAKEQGETRSMLESLQGSPVVLGVLYLYRCIDGGWSAALVVTDGVRERAAYGPFEKVLGQSGLAWVEPRSDYQRQLADEALARIENLLADAVLVPQAPEVPAALASLLDSPPRMVRRDQLARLEWNLERDAAFRAGIFAARLNGDGVDRFLSQMLRKTPLDDTRASSARALLASPGPRIGVLYLYPERGVDGLSAAIVVSDGVVESRIGGPLVGVLRWLGPGSAQ